MELTVRGLLVNFPSSSLFFFLFIEIRENLTCSHYCCFRFLGAGWGGATVSLVLEPDVPKFLEALQEGYYKKHFPEITEKEFKDACFATKPELGACIFEGEIPKEEEK